jgi:hypothetical protein
MNPQILITVNEQGSINVQGAIDNTILALGLLESAKHAVLEHAKRKASGIVAASAADAARLAVVK